MSAGNDSARSARQIESTARRSRSRRFLRGARELVSLLDRRGVAVYGAVCLLEAAAAPLLVTAVSAAVDDVVRNPKSRSAAGAALVLGALTIAQRVISDGRGAIANALGLTAVRRATRCLIRHAMTLSGAEVDDPAVQDALARASQGISNGAVSVLFSVGTLLASGGAIVGILVTLAGLSSPVAALCVASVAPAYVAQRAVSRRLYEHRQRVSVDERRNAYVGSLLMAPVSSLEARVNGFAEPLADQWDDRSKRLLQGWQREYAKTALMGVAGGVAGTLCIAAAYWRLVAAGGSPGDLAAAFAAVGLLVANLGFVVQAWTMVERNSLFLEDWRIFLSTSSAVAEAPHPRRLPGSPMHVDVQGVSFSYREAEPALRDVTVSIQPGEMLAVVGHNGAGKSTLVRLLCRMYDPDDGAIRIGGVDLRDVRLADLRDRLGVLFQDFTHHQLTVREAVTLGARSDPDDADVFDALAAVGLEGVVQRSGGLDAQLGRLFPGGRELSGGEWQRLALARIFLQQPAIWILDEPTSALDPGGELELFAAMKTRLGSHVGVVVSHRFSTVRLADQILVLENGSVAELGSHEELVAKRGLYYSLFDKQAAAFR